MRRRHRRRPIRAAGVIAREAAADAVVPTRHHRRAVKHRLVLRRALLLHRLRDDEIGPTAAAGSGAGRDPAVDRRILLLPDPGRVPPIVARPTSATVPSRVALGLHRFPRK